MLENLRHIYSIRFILYSLNIMALESLSNPLQALAVLPYAMNLRSQDATTNDSTWSATTQYFHNDVVRSPLTGGLYVYEAWDVAGAQNLPDAIVSANDPSSAAGLAEGWAPAQGNGLTSVVQNSAAVTGGTVALANLGATTGLILTLPAALGVASTWLVKLDYTATLATPPFTGTEWLTWTVTPNGTAPVVRVSSHVFGAAAPSGGSPVSVVVTLPADGTSLTPTGVQSAAASNFTFTGGVVATYARLS